MDIMQEILSEVKQTHQRIGNLEQGQNNLIKRVDSLEQGQIGLIKRMDNLEQGQIGLIKRMDNLEQGQIGLIKRMDNLEKDVGILKDDVDNLKEKVQVIRNSQLICENEWYPKISVTLDCIFGINKKNTQQDNRLDRLERATENHELRLHIIENRAV